MATTDQPAIEHKADGRSSDVWKRGLFTLAFMVLYSVGQSLLFLTAVIQFIWLLVAGAPNALLSRFGNALAIWLAEAARFLTCASESKPFPWQEWPRGE
jgi:hypothetical protein